MDNNTKQFRNIIYEFATYELEPALWLLEQAYKIIKSEKFWSKYDKVQVGL